MKVDRHAKSNSCFPQRRELRSIQKLAIGGAIDQRTKKTVLCDTVFELIRGCLWILGFECGPTCQPVGMRSHRFRQFVIHVMQQCGSSGGIQLGYTNRCKAHYLKVDAALHRCDTTSTEIQQLWSHLLHRRVNLTVVSSRCVQERVGDEVLFKRNYLHVIGTFLVPD